LIQTYWVCKGFLNLNRKSLFERLDQGHFWLSKTPDVPGSKSWLTTKPRMVSCVKLNTRTKPVQTVWFFKTHLTTISDNAKRESASIINERMKSIAGSGAVILTGDFNTKACTEIYRLFLTNKAGLYPSDHFPVKAVLEINLAE
jgi:endonuclease/exonuclease/phosphatase family metal-dependent hydrolase